MHALTDFKSFGVSLSTGFHLLSACGLEFGVEFVEFLLCVLGVDDSLDGLDVSIVHGKSVLHWLYIPNVARLYDIQKDGFNL